MGRKKAPYRLQIWKRCRERGCRDPKCLHTFSVKGTLLDGRELKEFRLDAFSAPRMKAQGRQVHNVTREREMETEWRPLIAADILAGNDPSRDYQVIEPSLLKRGVRTVGQLLDTWFTKHVGRNCEKTSVPTIAWHIRVIERHIGTVAATQAALAGDEDGEHEGAVAGLLDDLLDEYDAPQTPHKILSTLRACINWCRDESKPPLTDARPFGKGGVKITKKHDRKRNRRLTHSEDEALFAACKSLIRDQAGDCMVRRLVCALDLPTRLSEMLAIRNADVNPDEGSIEIKYQKNHSAATRRVFFDPEGRLADIVRERRRLGLAAHPFGGPNGEYVTNFKSAWATLRLVAFGQSTLRERTALADGTLSNVNLTKEQRQFLREVVNLHWHDLRHEGAVRLYLAGTDIVQIQTMLGHTSIDQTRDYINLKDLECKQALQNPWKVIREQEAARAKVRAFPVVDARTVVRLSGQAAHALDLAVSGVAESVGLEIEREEFRPGRESWTVKGTVSALHNLARTLYSIGHAQGTKDNARVRFACRREADAIEEMLNLQVAQTA